MARLRHTAVVLSLVIAAGACSTETPTAPTSTPAAPVVTAPPAPPADPPPPPVDSNPAFEDEVLALVNQHRAAGATCGGTAKPPVAPLAMNAELRSAARGHSQDMAIRNYFSHTSLDGRTFDQRIRDAGYAGAFPLGENIAGGQSSPQAVVEGWMSSPGHCTNIMLADFKAIGVGYAHLAGSTLRHYWTQNFGGS